MHITVHSGDQDRPATLVRTGVPASRLGLQSGGEREGNLQVSVRDDVTGKTCSGQYDLAAEALSFVLRDPLKAGESRTLSVQPAPLGAGDEGLAATFVSKLERVQLEVGGRPFATYIVDGTRKPYFWPVLGPAGASLVRGQGSPDHPHHTGLGVCYGGHSEGGSVNIWSDWDELPYGPGGRMLHRGFRALRAGPVFGELVQDLTYVDADGDAFVDEVRTVRWWWAGDAARFIDIESRILSLKDRGPSPFIIALRTPTSFGEARRRTAAPDATTVSARVSLARWVDASGPTGEPPAGPPDGPPEEHPDAPGARRVNEQATGPVNGIAILDHPANHGFPNPVGKYATVQQLTQVHYPPPDAPEGPFSFQTRILVHDGDGAEADVEAVARDYATPCRIELGG